MSALRDLVEKATPGPWEHHHAEVATYGVDIVVAGDRHVGRQFRREDATLIALAPDLALLCADMKVYLEGSRTESVQHGLIQRIEELEARIAPDFWRPTGECPEC